jgi:hypothetical protein
LSRKIGRGDAGKVDLAHQLVVEAHLEIGRRQVGERLVGRATRGADDGVDRADRLEQRFEAGGILDVGRVRAVARGGNHLVAGRQGGDDGFADGAGGANDDDLHSNVLERVSARPGLGSGWCCAV